MPKSKGVEDITTIQVLAERLDNHMQTTNGKIDDLKQVVVTRVDRVEKDVRELQDLHLTLQPEKKHAEYDKTQSEWVDFKTRLKVYVGLFLSLITIIQAIVIKVVVK